jgi:hypothetical protein
MEPSWKARHLAQAVLVVMCCAACHPSAPGLTPVHMNDGSRWLTPDLIAHASSTNAWDLLRECNTGYRLVESANGNAVKLTTRRGRSSFLLADADRIVVVVDGMRINDARYLRQIPTSTVLTIQMLSGIDGTTYFGTNAGAGVILVTTRIPRD